MVKLVLQLHEKLRERRTVADASPIDSRVQLRLFGEPRHVNMSESPLDERAAMRALAFDQAIDGRKV